MPDKVGKAIKVQCASARVRLVVDVPTNLARDVFSFREIAGFKVWRATGPDRIATPAVGAIVPGHILIIPLDAAVALIFRPAAHVFLNKAESRERLGG